MVETLVRVRQSGSGVTETPLEPLPIDRTLRSIPGSLLPVQKEEELPSINGAFEYLTVAVKATPKRMQIGTLTNDQLRLKKSIEVEIEQEGSDYIANCVYLDEFGFGESPMQAVDDLRSAIVELYFELNEKRAELGAGLLETLTHLEELIEEL